MKDYLRSCEPGIWLLELDGLYTRLIVKLQSAKNYMVFCIMIAYKELFLQDVYGGNMFSEYAGVGMDVHVGGHYRACRGGDFMVSSRSHLEIWCLD